MTGYYEMMMIRKATKQDISRIAEIHVFVKRVKYRSIFHDDEYSFGELQVLNIAKQYDNADILNNMWVYDDGIVKGLIHIDGNEVKELYVDSFFWGDGIGSALLKFAVEEFDAGRLWVLEKNIDAIKFYKAHGFVESGAREITEGTTEYEVELIRKKLR